MRAAKPTRRARKPARRRRFASLKVSDGFRTFVLDQLEELGDVTPKAMFGGVGLYKSGTFFAILARDTLFLRVDDRTVKDYTDAGMKPFRPFPGRSGSKHYYAVPLSVLESQPELTDWARKAVAAARRSC